MAALSESEFHARVPWPLCCVNVSTFCVKELARAEGSDHIQQSEDKAGSISHA